MARVTCKQLKHLANEHSEYYSPSGRISRLFEPRAIICIFFHAALEVVSESGWHKQLANCDFLDLALTAVVLVVSASVVLVVFASAWSLREQGCLLR